MRLAISFTNFGPYHLARMRALASALARDGGRLLAYETAGAERRYPWLTTRQPEPFDWTTLFPGRAVEAVAGTACSAATWEALDRDRPDAVAIVGYSRPESMAALDWAEHAGRPALLLSESQQLDHPRTWWKEAIKRRRVRRFAAGLVGGPRHRDYLVALGMPPDRIALGYNAVDNAQYARAAEAARRDPTSREGLPARPFFLAVSRFVPEKNLSRLVRAFARYRDSVPAEGAWDLALCGGGPGSEQVEATVADSGLSHAIHRPGFLQADGLARWYAHASAFVHPSLMEPWGLVVNEAAACGLPLLVSDRAGCVETLVPDSCRATGRRFEPRDEAAIASALGWMAALPDDRRAELGRAAVDAVACWGPDRFARGMMEALDLAQAHGPAPASLSMPARRRAAPARREALARRPA